jgi:hypothetical protein
MLLVKVLRSCAWVLLAISIPNGIHAQEIEYESTLKIADKQSKLPTTHFSISSHIGSLRNLNLGIGMKLGLQLGKYLCVGGGIAGSSLVYTVKTDSDEHAVDMGSIPMFGFAELFLYNPASATRGFYVYGNSGRNQRIGSQDNLPDRTYKAPYREVGIGFLKKNSFYLRSNVRYEIGWQHLSYKGVANSTYNAKIDYELHFRSFLVRVVAAF